MDPQGRGRQYVSSQAETLAGTRMAGFVFTRQAPAGKWGAATYALKKTTGEEPHRDHRGHKEERPSEFADAPYAPYADGNRDTDAADASTGDSGATVRSETNVAVDADANLPPQSGSEKTEAPGWRTRL
jgi:hypothetical protein